MKKSVAKFSKCLRKISIGKYSHVFYLSGSSDTEFGSLLGGCVSLTLTIIFLFYTFVTFQSVFNRVDYTLETYYHPLSDKGRSPIYELKLNTLIETIKPNITIENHLHGFDTETSCRDLFVVFRIANNT